MQSDGLAPVRVLLVDDDPLILRSLQRILRRRPGLETDTAGNGEAALVKLGQQGFDVVVSDIQMPEMAGYELLRRVRTEHPAVVRVVLSSAVCEEQALGLVHQYWTKPWETETMLAALERTARVVRALQSPRWRQAASAIDTLPAAPGVVQRLNAAVVAPDTSAAEIARIVASDPAIAAKLLQLANSAFFGVSSQTTSLEQAVVRLGVRTIHHLTIAAALWAALDRPTGQLAIDRLQAVSLFVGQVASQLLAEPAERDAAFAAGLLRGVGQLVFAVQVTAAYDEVLAEAARATRPVVDIERERFGVTHADVGAYLLGIWGLPEAVVEAVARQYGASPVPPRAETIVDALRMAVGLVLGGREPGFETYPIDLRWLAHASTGAPSPEWSHLVSRLLASHGPVRRAPRFVVRWSATFNTDASQFAAEVLDVSPEGMFVSAAQLLPPETRITITLELPKGPSIGLAGTVRWAGHSATHGCTGFGIELGEVAPELAAYLSCLTAVGKA